MARHPEATYVEMDTVKGCREKGKRMLTMLFVEQNLMLIFLMRDGKADTVVEQLEANQTGTINLMNDGRADFIPE